MKTITAIIFASLFSLTGISQVIHFQQGNSLRNNQLGHYYKMVSWNDAPYQEFAHWVTSGTTVVEFMNWRIVFPPGYQPQESQKYPMILMLHGAGESGREWGGHFSYTPDDPRFDNNGNNLLWGGEEHLIAVNKSSNDPRSFPGIVVFPQVSYSGVWSTDWNNGTLNANGRMTTTIVEYLIQNHHVDPYRIYIHGLSGGAKGVWELAAKRPDLFAAMLPMSGVGSDIDMMTDILVTTPLWLFQGGLDTNPSPGYSNQWITALKNKGGSPRYTIYPNLDHGTWNTAYQEPDFFSWMLSQDKRKIYVFSDNTSLENQSSIRLGFSAGFTDYQWKRNGAVIAGANTRYYTVTHAGNYTVQFRRRIDGALDESYPTQITEGEKTLNGLAFQYYEYAGNFPGLSSFDFSQPPTTTGNINNFYLYRKRSDQYSLSLDGVVQIDKPGPHRFYTRSADGSLLFVNGVKVVDNDGQHEPRVVSGTYNFPSPGKYPIRCLYFNQSTESSLTIAYNEGTLDNFSLANMFADKQLFLPGSVSSGRTTMASASPLSDYRTQQTDWYSYYEEQIKTDTTKVSVFVYPNPFTDEIQLSFLKELGKVPVGIYDIRSGQTMRQFVVDSDAYEVRLDVDDLPHGLYLLTVGRSRFKVMKRP